MRSKKIKILIVLAILALAGATWWWFESRPNNDPLERSLLSPGDKAIIKTVIQKAPASAISENDLKRVTVFLKSYAMLFNSYSYDVLQSTGTGDAISYHYKGLNDIRGLLDYQTAAMQKKTVARLAELEQQDRPGFSVATKPDLSTLVYQPIDANSLIAALKADVEEFENYQSLKKYQVDYLIKVEFGAGRRILISDTALSVAQ